MLPAEDTTDDFEEMANDDEAALSDEDRHTMEVVECTIKHLDEFKFQISSPLRHITLNLPDNGVVAKNKLEQQHQSLKHKSERIMKYHEKIKRLKT